MLSRLHPGAMLLAPLVIRTSEIARANSGQRVDARIEAAMEGEDHRFRFVVESKSRSTLEALHAAIGKARAEARDNEWSMIQVPYLSPERLEFLQREQVSGVDLCGNGVVIIPGRLCVVRSGQPNRYRDSRPLNNPYRGRSGLVARTLLERPSWPSLSGMVEWINQAGADLSMAQASKAIAALQGELIVRKVGGAINLQDPLRLLDKLGLQWKASSISVRQAFRVGESAEVWARRLSSDSRLNWAVSGESSASRYVLFTQGGPRRIAVSDLPRATSLLGGTPESVSNFADIELLERADPGAFFQSTIDETGTKWASRLQTWLELQSGDARQREAAEDVKRQILQRSQQ